MLMSGPPLQLRRVGLLLGQSSGWFKVVVYRSDRSLRLREFNDSSSYRSGCGCSIFENFSPTVSRHASLLRRLGYLPDRSQNFRRMARCQGTLGEFHFPRSMPFVPGYLRDIHLVVDHVSVALAHVDEFHPVLVLARECGRRLRIGIGRRSLTVAWFVSQIAFLHQRVAHLLSLQLAR